MKKKINILVIMIIVLCSSILSSLKAQPTFMLDNGRTCDVLIGYEIGDPSSSCNVCTSGTLLIPGGSFVNFPACVAAGFDRICIILLEIDGVPVSNCHNDCSFLTNCCQNTCTSSGVPADANCGSATFNIVVVPGTSWTIN
jgi:hypothetical protein